MYHNRLKSWSAQQAIAILAVDNIKVNELGLKLLKQREDGLISYEDARAEVREQAKNFASQNKTLK